MLELATIWVFRILALGVVVGTVLPLVRRDAWWIRGCEFPRVQILAAALVLLALAPWAEPALVPRALALVGLGAAVVLQGARIVPFTPLWRRCEAVAVAAGDGPVVSLLIANVLMTNREPELLIARVEALAPDLLLVIEADDWWREALAPLDEAYPHRVERPQEDTYGMLLFSRLPLRDTEVRFLVEESVPSIRCRVEIPGLGSAVFYGLHPRPPVPHETTDTTERDAELLLVAREVAAAPEPTIVAGDLNDVAWSYTTRLFRKLSGLRDPRIGRGTFSTFPAALPWLRFPLDHIYHSPHFGLVELVREREIGSDHLPIFARLRPLPGPVPRANPEEEDVELAGEKIARGLED